MDKLRSPFPQAKAVSVPPTLKVLGPTPDLLALPPKLKLAIFDLDDTLITTLTGAHFPQDMADWKLRFPNVPETLRALQEADFTLLIITNQLGISQGYYEFNHFRAIVEAFLVHCGVEAFVFAALADDEFRKPAIGAFDFFWEFIGRKQKKASSSGNPGEVSAGLLGKRPVLKEMGPEDPALGAVRRKSDRLKPPRQLATTKFYLKAPSDWEFGLGYDLDRESFYCGDAAGRWQEDQRDFSDSDILFAVNTKINFALPEQVFGQTVVAPLQELPSFRFSEPIELNPEKFRADLGLERLRTRAKANLLVLLVGPPGCGKTHFASTYLSAFALISYVA